MKIKKKSGSGGANWMDTYGDMVTLLLCFFVMLYSMSNMDRERWIALVGSFNPAAVTTSETANGAFEGVPEDQSTVTQVPLTNADIEVAMEQLYQAMTDYAVSSGMSGQISIGRGSGYVFISFDDTVFFNGDSYELRQEGRDILDQVALMLADVSDSIDEIRVLGHTAQSRPDQPNNATADRFLASNRATVVTLYLQEKDIIDPARLVSVGYGQWRPVSSNQTSEERAHNRRVELVVAGLDVEDTERDSITEYYTMYDSVEEIGPVTDGTAADAATADVS